MASSPQEVLQLATILKPDAKLLDYTEAFLHPTALRQLDGLLRRALLQATLSFRSGALGEIPLSLSVPSPASVLPARELFD